MDGTAVIFKMLYFIYVAVNLNALIKFIVIFNQNTKKIYLATVVFIQLVCLPPPSLSWTIFNFCVE